MIYNEEYFYIEKLLTDYIIKYCDMETEKSDFHFHVTVKDTLPEPYKEYPPLIRISIRSNKVNKRAQELIKNCFKDIFKLDKSFLEREYGSTSKEILYEIVYKVSEETFDNIRVLSKIVRKEVNSF